MRAKFRHRIKPKGHAMTTSSVFQRSIKPAIFATARGTARVLFWTLLISVVFAVVATLVMVTINQVNPAVFQHGNIQLNDFSMAMDKDFFAMDIGEATLGLLVGTLGFFIAFWAVLFAALVVIATFSGVAGLFVGLACLFLLPALLIALPVWWLARKTSHKAVPMTA
jgi:hypothetical protein